jgi:hypothetical protein
MRPDPGTLAAKADPQDLYQRSVQQPSTDIRFFDRVFHREYGRRPLSLREDFCGAAAVACAWVRSHPERKARAIDLDPKVLVWGALHNQVRLPAAARKRVQLVQADVLTVVTPKADVVAAQNFSFCVFKTRAALGAYFRAARRALGREGMLVLDVLGGHETQMDDHEEIRREAGGVHYVWEQKRFDPIQQRGVFAIHFRFKDGSEIRDAFRYDWRMWTIPEIRELLDEAGFRRSDVYWEEDDGNYRRRESAPAQAVCVTVVVGVV